MSKIDVINVGQGDSIILSPGNRCKFSDHDIFVDVGRGDRDVFDFRGSKRGILLLSHSHLDHIGGLINYFDKYIGFIDQIWIPLYFEEIDLIAQFILKIKGINYISARNASYFKCKTQVYFTKLMKYLSEKAGMDIDGLYEGKDICNHISVYNPPVNPADLLGLNRDYLEKYYLEQRKNRFEDFRGWFNNIDFNNLINILIGEQYNYFLIKDKEFNRENGIKFMTGLLYKLSDSINSFINNPNLSNFDKIYRNLRLSSNNASIVFKYNDKDLDVLFTGDADTSVFKRILHNGIDLSSNILKVPHHGSKNNLNKTIIQKINPKIAIISHNNGKFGRQKDPHPNIEIIDLLDKLNITTIYTNDVEKGSNVIKRKPMNTNVATNIYYHS